MSETILGLLLLTVEFPRFRRVPRHGFSLALVCVLEIVATREDFRSFGWVGVLGESVFMGHTLFPAEANNSSPK